MTQYETRVKALAEKMAEKSHNDFARLDWQKWGYLADLAKQAYIQKMLPLAEIAVAEMAKVGKDCYTEGYVTRDCGADFNETNFIKSLGLTPDKNNDNANK